MLTTELGMPWETSHVAQIDDVGVDVVVVERAPLWLSMLAPLPPTGRVNAIVSPNTFERVTRDSLFTIGIDPASPVGIALHRDVAAITASFLEQFAVTKANYRLDVSAGTSCPKFHSDVVHVRLITTYVGPGTEFVHQDRAMSVVRIATGSLCFLKGRLHATYGDSVLHRSPEVDDDGARLILALDF